MGTIAKILGYTIGAAVVVAFIDSKDAPTVIQNALGGWTGILNAIKGGNSQ